MAGMAGESTTRPPASQRRMAAHAVALDVDAATASLPAHLVVTSAAHARRLSWGEAQLVGWGLLAAVSLVLNAMRSGHEVLDAKARVLLALYPAGQVLAAGVVVGAATRAFRARGSRSLVWTAVAVLVAGFTLGWTVLKDDFLSLTNRLAYLAPPVVWRILITLACAATIPSALLVGRLLARRATIAGVAGGLALHVVLRNYFFPTVFPGVHLLATIACAAMIGSALGGARVPEPLAALFERSPFARKLPWVLAALWGGCAVFIPPPSIVSYRMLQPPAASFAPFLARLRAPQIPPPRTPEEASAALAPALSSAPSAPSQASLLPRDGAVILVTIDCFRADLLETDKHEAALPNLVALRRASAQFTQARSAGNLTLVALSSIFTGRFESQLAWAERQTPHKRYLVPAQDPAPRFPELLGAAGVPSTTFVGAEGFDGGSGILRGFTEERWLAPEVGLAHGEDLVASAIDRVEHHQGGPLFLYVHLFDAHDPYDRAGKHGTEFERYLRELTLVDREVGRLVAAVDRRFGDRSVLIVSADHGEAFGEHHTARHGNTVYDEVVRVPLLVRGRGIAPRVIADSVSTIDLGPTVLDLFRVPAPGSFMGQSLVPLLAGEPFVRARPVAIESRGMAALVDGGFKILRSKHYDTVELYDLGADPGETDNLFREDSPAAVERLRAMDAFFADAGRR
jgi:hypothetical protein